VNALRKMSWLELKLFTREPVTVLFTLALPLLILYVLGGVFTDPAQPDEFRGVGGQNYYPPAYVGLVTASIGLIALPVHIAGYRERGVLRRFRASAVPAVSVFGAQVFVAFVAATFSALVLIGAALQSWDIFAPKSLPGVLGVRRRRAVLRRDRVPARRPADLSGSRSLYTWSELGFHAAGWYSLSRPRAPRGALLYPRCSWEELGGTFLGLMAHLDLKRKGDSSMPGKQRSRSGV